MTRSVDIIIVNYNTEALLRQCLESVGKINSIHSIKTIVVDNFSPNREIQGFPEQFPDVGFIFSETNRGFGAGCNLGVQSSNSEYILFLNPDTILPPDSVNRMVEFMDNHNDAGACGPKFENFDGKSAYTYNMFPNLNWEFMEFLGVGHDLLLKRLESKIELNNNTAFEVDWMTGACLLVRRDVFQRAGGFDEDYFLYYEDTDLQLRIAKQGYKIFCLPYIVVRHFVNSSVKDDELREVYSYHLNRSKLLYYYKNENVFTRSIMRLLMISGLKLRILALPFRDKFSRFRHQKFRQYIKILKLYMLPFESLKRTGLQK